MDPKSNPRLIARRNLLKEPHEGPETGTSWYLLLEARRRCWGGCHCSGGFGERTSKAEPRGRMIKGEHLLPEWKKWAMFSFCLAKGFLASGWWGKSPQAPCRNRLCYSSAPSAFAIDAVRSTQTLLVDELWWLSRTCMHHLVDASALPTQMEL